MGRFEAKLGKIAKAKLMLFCRPTFRIWPTVAAILLAYPISGFLYGLSKMIWIIVPAPPPGLTRSGLALVGVLYAFFMAVLTPLSLGFPLVDPDTNARANLYPVIVPIAIVLVALASGVIGRARNKT